MSRRPRASYVRKEGMDKKEHIYKTQKIGTDILKLAKRNQKIKNGSLKEVKKILIEHKEELYKKYSVKEIGLFGSLVRGEQKKSSDIDILVEFEEVPGLLKFIELELYFEKLLRKKVDLVRKKALRPELKDIILRETVYI